MDIATLAAKLRTANADLPDPRIREHARHEHESYARLKTWRSEVDAAHELVTIARAEGATHGPNRRMVVLTCLGGIRDRLDARESDDEAARLARAWLEAVLDERFYDVIHVSDIPKCDPDWRELHELSVRSEPTLEEEFPWLLRVRPLPAEAVESLVAACVVPGDDVPGQAPRSDGGFRPACWFPPNMQSRLRKAAAPDRKTKKVRRCFVDGVACYCVDDARKWWPDDMNRA